MSTCLEQIFNSINTWAGVAGSIITIFDHFKNKGNTYIEELFTAIRNKSKEAYDLYCEYCEHRNNDIGVPLEGDILGYWESCVRRDTLPSVDDMRSSNIASTEEAEIMLAYLMEAWMEIPDFVEWLHGMLAQNKLDELSIRLSDLQKNMEGISDLANELKQQNISNIAFLISPNRIVYAKYSCTDLDIKHYYMVDNSFRTIFKVISAKQDKHQLYSTFQILKSAHNLSE